jgi:hypothetical protein
MKNRCIIVQIREQTIAKQKLDSAEKKEVILDKENVILQRKI